MLQYSVLNVFDNTLPSDVLNIIATLAFQDISKGINIILVCKAWRDLLYSSLEVLSCSRITEICFNFKNVKVLHYTSIIADIESKRALIRFQQKFPTVIIHNKGWRPYLNHLSLNTAITSINIDNRIEGEPELDIDYLSHLYLSKDTDGIVDVTANIDRKDGMVDVTAISLFNCVNDVSGISDRFPNVTKLVVGKKCLDGDMFLSTLKYVSDPDMNHLLEPITNITGIYTFFNLRDLETYSITSEMLELAYIKSLTLLNDHATYEERRTNKIKYEDMDFIGMFELERLDVPVRLSSCYSLLNDSLSNLTHLTIYEDSNYIFESEQGIMRIKSLEIYYIEPSSVNQLTNSWWSRFPELEELKCHESIIRHNISNIISECTKLKTLHIFDDALERDKESDVYLIDFMGTSVEYINSEPVPK